MEPQGSYSPQTDLLDLSLQPLSKSANRNCDSNAWREQTIDVNASHLRAQGGSKKNPGVLMSDEELKIRWELETDIEKSLEEEIKDGIYHLALRLHRLYQHQQERNARELSESRAGNHRGTKKKTLSELNINIKMEGGTKIEIKEIKREARERGRPGTSTSQKVAAPEAKRFDWAKSLRSGPGPVAITKKQDSPHHARILSNNRVPCVNLKLDSARRNCTTASGQRKPNDNKKLLELGWRG